VRSKTRTQPIASPSSNSIVSAISALTDTSLAVSAATGVTGAANIVLVQQVQRNNALLKITRCGEDTAEPLDYFSSPMQLEVGSDWTKYHRGAVIGNTAIVAVALLLYSLALPILMRAKDISFSEALVKSKYPTHIFSVAALFASPNAFSGAILLFYGAGASDVLLLLFVGLLVPFLPLVVLFVVFCRFSAFEFSLQPINAAKKNAKDSCGTKTLSSLRWAVRPTHQWQPEDHLFMARFASIFDPVRKGWFPSFDWLVTICVSILAGAAGNIKTSNTVCVAVCSATLSIFILYFVVLLVAKPFLARATTLIQLALTAFSILSAILALLTLVGKEPDERLATSVAFAQNFVAIIGAICGVVEIGIDLFDMIYEDEKIVEKERNLDKLEINFNNNNDNKTVELTEVPLLQHQQQQQQQQQQPLVRRESSGGNPLLQVDNNNSNGNTPLLSFSNASVNSNNNINLGNNNNNNNSSTKNLVKKESSESAAMTNGHHHIVIGDALWKNLADDDAIAADISAFASDRTATEKKRHFASSNSGFFDADSDFDAAAATSSTSLTLPRNDLQDRVTARGAGVDVEGKRAELNGMLAFGSAHVSQQQQNCPNHQRHQQYDEFDELVFL
jgi:hypothetical protein